MLQDDESNNTFLKTEFVLIKYKFIQNKGNSIMNIVHSVPISAKKFTQKDLELSNLYFNPLVYPGLYHNAELGDDFKYVDRRIVDIDSITPDDYNVFTDSDLKKNGNNIGFTQSAAIRAQGRGDNADKVDASIASEGYELSHAPISVALCPNKKDMILDGRTRLKQLKRLGFTNVIVDYYLCNSWNAYIIEGAKRNPPTKPRSPMKKEDIITNCNVAVKNGWMKREVSDIEKRIKEIAGNLINYYTKQKIIHSVMYGVGHTSEVVSFDETTASNWMKRNGYIDNDRDNGIFYKVVSASAWSKAITATADKLCEELEANGVKVKELRVVLHTGTLDGADPSASWQGKIDSFRSGWKSDLHNIEKAFFVDSSRRPIIKLYGAIPAVTELSSLYPMDRLVMFHVGKLKTMSFSEIAAEEALNEELM